MILTCTVRGVVTVRCKLFLEVPAELLATQWYSPDIEEDTDVNTNDPPRVQVVPVGTKGRDPLYHLEKL